MDMRLGYIKVYCLFFDLYYVSCSLRLRIIALHAAAYRGKRELVFFNASLIRSAFENGKIP